MRKKTMRLMQRVMVWAVAALLASSCAARQSASDEAAESTADGVPAAVEDPGNVIAFDDGLPEPEPVPTLLPATPPEERASQVQRGRPDPFAPLAATPVVMPTRVATPGRPQALAPVPIAAPQALPPLPVTTTPVPLQPTPSGPPPQPQTIAAGPQPVAPAAPPAAPAVSLVDAIEVSGVVQVGGRTSVIVQVPNERSSRSAMVGDRLANGQVLVKRIDLNQGDPVVVLEHNGVEVMRSVSLMGG